MEVEIVHAAEAGSGRFHLEVVGQRPFRILRSSARPDGLIESEVEYFDFDGPPTTTGGGGDDDVDDQMARTAEAT